MCPLLFDVISCGPKTLLFGAAPSVDCPGHHSPSLLQPYVTEAVVQVWDYLPSYCEHSELCRARRSYELRQGCSLLCFPVSAISISFPSEFFLVIGMFRRHDMMYLPRSDLLPRPDGTSGRARDCREPSGRHAVSRSPCILCATWSVEFVRPGTSYVDEEQPT
jgi:hypothetical protein